MSLLQLIEDAHTARSDPGHVYTEPVNDWISRFVNEVIRTNHKPEIILRGYTRRDDVDRVIVEPNGDWRFYDDDSYEGESSRVTFAYEPVRTRVTVRASWGSPDAVMFNFDPEGEMVALGIRYG